MISGCTMLSAPTTPRTTNDSVTGAYRAVVYIKENMNLNATTASEKDSKEVVRICTVYAQKGMWNIFIVVFCFALALPFFNPYFFIGYLIGIAFFGLFQAIFMANAGGAWDNAKKNCRSGFAPEKHPASRRERRRRHGG